MRRVGLVAPIASLAVASVVASGCLRETSLELERVAGRDAAVFALISPDAPAADRFRLFAVDLTEPSSAAYPITLDDQTVAAALYWDESFEELQLDPGLVPLAPIVGAQTTSPRPLPPWDTGRRVTSSGESVAWVDDPSLATLLAEVRLRPLDVPRCVDAGGCLDPERPGLCAIPCVGPSRPPILAATPEPPALTEVPCPDGTTGLSLDDGPLCEPPARGPPCPVGQVQPFGAASCLPIRTCPAGQWADELVEAPRTFWVRAGASGGDGSRSAPFATIGRALTAAGTGSATIAIARGRYEEALEVRTDVVLRGACVEGTVVVAPVGSAPVLRVQGAVRASDLALRGGTNGVVVEAGGGLIADRVELASASGTAWVARPGARSTGVGVVVRDAGGAGLELDGSTSSFVGLTIEGAERSGIAVVGGSAVVRAVAVRDVTTDRDGDTAGLHVSGAARVDATDVSIEGAPAHGVVVVQGSTLTAHGLTVRDARPAGSVDVDEAEADGVVVAQRARISLERGIVARVETQGLTVLDEGTTAEVHTSIVRGVVAKRAGLGEGQGLAARSRGVLVAERVLVEDATWRGVLADNGGVLRMTSAIVRRTRSSPRQWPGGTGVTVASGAEAELSRVVIEDSVNGGLQGDEAVGITASDLRVSRVALDPYATGIELEGDGVRVRTSPLVLTRTLVEDVVTTGLRVFPTTQHPVAIDDLTVRRSAGGLRVKGSATTVLRRISIEDVNGFGIAVIRDAGEFIDRQEITAEDVVIRDVRAPSATCRACPPGVGVWGVDTGNLRLHTFELTRCESAGASIQDQAQLALSEGRVTANGVGVSATSVPFDLTRLLDRVVFEDNDAGIVVSW